MSKQAPEFWTQYTHNNFELINAIETCWQRGGAGRRALPHPPRAPSAPGEAGGQAQQDGFRIQSQVLQEKMEKGGG